MSALHRVVAILLVLFMLGLPVSAFANCTLSGNKEVLTMTLPATITVDPTAAVGTVLATSAAVDPNPNSSSVSCTGTTTIGVINLIGAQPSSTSTLFPTNVPGVSYRILHPDSSYYLPPYGADSIASGSYTLSVKSAIQLVKTGTITTGQTISAGTVGYWQYKSGGGTARVEDFNLANAVKFVAQTCTVTTATIAVTLPNVSSTSLNRAGATSGATPFTIGLNCSGGASGQTLAIEIDPQRTVPANTTGVLTSTGTAANVAVQLTDSSQNPLTLSTPITMGTTPTGTYNLNFYAQYYALTASPGPGSVTATATFTISYP